MTGYSTGQPTVRSVRDCPFTYGSRYLTFRVPEVVKRWLDRRISWHLMICAVK